MTEHEALTDRLPISREETPLSARGLGVFVERLREHPGVKIDGPSLWSALAIAFPRRPSGPAERAYLMTALRHAEARGVIQLPPPHGKRWDRTASPPVPREVVRITRENVVSASKWRAAVWHPLLQWVPDLNRLTEEEEQFLRRVHDGLVSGAFQTAAPFKHRSLTLTGDEKRLAALADGRLFAPGRLTIQLIGAERELPPLAWTCTGNRPAPRVLVFENAGPSDLAVRLLREFADAPYDVVAFGAGRSFPLSIARLRELDPSAISYVGDLDSDGIAIAAAASESTVKLGLPELTPAPGMHAAMLASADALGCTEGWPVDQRRTVRGKPGGNRPMLWLPDEVRVSAGRILDLGRRIPEEVLGPSAMRDVFRKTCLD